MMKTDRQTVLKAFFALGLYFGIVSGSIAGTTTGTITSLASQNDNILKWSNNGYLRRITNQGGAIMSADSSLVLHAGDHHNNEDADLGITPTTTAENLWLTSDGEVKVITNWQDGIANAKTWTFKRDGRLMAPDGTEVGSGGSSLPAKSMDVFSVAGTYTWDWVAAGKPNVVYVSMIGGGQGGYAEGVISAAYTRPGQWGEFVWRQPVNVSTNMSITIGGGGGGFTRTQSTAKSSNQGGQTSFGNISVAGGETIGNWCGNISFSGLVLSNHATSCVVTCPNCKKYTIDNGAKYGYKNTFFGNSGQGGAGSWDGGEAGQSGRVIVEW